MNKIFISCLLSSIILLSGCSNPFISSSTDTSKATTIENVAHLEKKQTGVPICDKYLSTLRCLAQASTGEESTKYMTTHNNLLLSRKDISVNQLTSICTSLTDSIIANPQALLTSNCKI